MNNRQEGNTMSLLMERACFSPLPLISSYNLACGNESTSTLSSVAHCREENSKQSLSQCTLNHRRQEYPLVYSVLHGLMSKQNCLVLQRQTSILGEVKDAQASNNCANLLIFSPQSKSFLKKDFGDFLSFFDREVQQWIIAVFLFFSRIQNKSQI